MRLRRTCKEAAALMIAREDRALPFGERIALRMHLMVCSTCPVFERQIAAMRAAFARWRAAPDEDDPSQAPPR